MAKKGAGVKRSTGVAKMEMSGKELLELYRNDVGMVYGSPTIEDYEKIDEYLKNLDTSAEVTTGNYPVYMVGLEDKMNIAQRNGHFSVLAESFEGYFDRKLEWFKGFLKKRIDDLLKDAISEINFGVSAGLGVSFQTSVTLDLKELLENQTKI